MIDIGNNVLHSHGFRVRDSPRGESVRYLSSPHEDLTRQNQNVEPPTRLELPMPKPSLGLY